MKTSHLSTAGFAHLALLAVIILSVIAGAYVLVTNSSAAKKATHINAATYNILSQRWDNARDDMRNWSERKDAVASIISQASPGVIGMQEVIKKNPDTGKFVSQRNDVIDFMKPLGYSHYVGSVNNSTPIFWKDDNFKAVAKGEVRLYDASTSKSTSPPASRYLTYVRLKQVHHNKRCLVLNYHFNQFESVSEQLKRIRQHVAGLIKNNPKDDVIFVGDFNKKHARVVKKLNGVITMSVADGYVGVDHVLVSDSVQVRGWSSSAVQDPSASDHNLVMAKLTI